MKLASSIKTLYKNYGTRSILASLCRAIEAKQDTLKYKDENLRGELDRELQELNICYMQIIKIYFK